MPVPQLRKLFCLAIVGLGSSLASFQPVFAGGRPVPVDPNCDAACEPTCGQQFCRTLKLHCVYFKRACSQKFILVPNPEACPPGFVPENCPTYSSPYPYPTINGYNAAPPMSQRLNGVFIR